jgi:prepilin-type N-terminal cleavage/methylation domain-containing protein/prepilin-type processing-associated H-X9-DG protein
MTKMICARGFTLIELLVVIATIGILSAIGIAGYSKYIESANKGREIHAGRVLMAGFHAYSADNSGRIIKAMDPKPGRVVDNNGKTVMSHAARRWPWRLAPYFDYNVDMIMVNNGEAAPKDNAMYSYLVTVFPTFGMNGTFVGGKFGTSMAPDHPRNRRGAFCVTNITQPVEPSKLIVFASAKMQNAPHPGCFDISAPGLGAVGEVDYKYGDKAVVLYFDGHVELNSTDQLKDMRRWSNLAAMQNDPNWKF